MVAGSMLAAFVLAACAGSDSGDSRSGTSVVPAPSLDARGAAEVAALAAYRGMWRSYAAAARTADVDDPELARYATGAALTVLRDGLATLKRRGEMIRGEYRSSPRVAEVTPSTSPVGAAIDDCLDDTDFRTYRADGSPAGDERGGRRATRATAERGVGGWRVTDFGIQKVGTC